MKTIENTNNTYFESFAFGDNPEMADELLALVLSGKKLQQFQLYWKMNRHQVLVTYPWYLMGMVTQPV